MDNEIEDFDTFYNRFIKSDSPDGGSVVSDKETPKNKDDKDSFEAFYKENVGIPLTSPSRQDLNLTGSEYKPVESTTIGSGVLGSGNFIKPAPVPEAHETEVDKIAKVPYSDQETRGFSTEILRAYSDPKTLKEIEEKVKWYVPTDEQLRVLQTHDREKTTKQALSELGGAAWEAFTQGPSLVGDMLQGAYGIGKGLTTGVLAATHAPIINKFGDQAAKDRVNQSIDEGIRSGRVLADAALSTGEAILEPIQRMSKGGSSWADSILDKSEEERFQNYKNRYISRVADYEAKEINPAVLARFTRWISNQNFYVPPEDIGYADPIRPEEMKAMSGPLVRELGAGLISSLTPSVEERLARHNGDRQAAAIEKQTEDMAASNSMIDASIANANRLVEDPSQVGFVGLVTPFNEFAAAGMLAKGANVGIRAGIQGARELGKTAEEINKLRSLQAAKAMEKAGTAAQALEKAGYLEQALEGTAKGIEYVGDTSQRLFNLVPEGIRPIAKQGAALAGLTGVGAGLGALSNDEAAGAGLGVGAYIGSKFPGVASDLLKARRLAAGKVGMLETASMLKNEMRPATTALTKFAGPKGDFFINNAKDFLKSNIDMAPLAVALGVYNDEDLKGIGRTIVEGGFLAGAHQLWGKAMGKDPIALERQNKARNLAAEKALLAASPEHRSNIDNLNWDRVVEQRETAAKKLERDHAIAAAENPDSPDAQRLFEQKETANRMYREAMGASVETRKRFAEEMRAYFGDAEAHINGVLSPGSNTKIELLTTDQIKDRFSTSGGQAPTASDLFPFTDSVGVSISGGRPVDRPWFGNLKDQIIINYDKLVANTRLTGDALPTALSHEVGHDLWRRKEYRTLMMPSYIELFGNEVQDEQGNVIAGKAGMYSDDALFSMYGEKYLSKYKNDPEAVKQFAIASGLWDYENNTINRKSAIQYMKEELLADAYTSNIDLPPDSPMRAGLKWVESKITNESLKRVLRALNSMGVDPFVGEATGAVYTPEVRNMVREAQRLIEKHNGLFEDVDPENPDPQPVITKKDILASKDLLQKYHSDSGKFVTTPSLIVIDADGTVIGQRPITTPNVFEGQWDYVADENGEIKPVQKRGYGPLPPEAEGMNIPEGATIRIQREIAYNKDGKPIEKSNSQTIQDIVARDAAIRDAIVAAADGTPGEVKPFTASGMSLRGRLTQKQRAAIMALPESMVSLATKEKLFKIMDTIAKDDGSRLNTEYAARLNDKGGYTPFRREMRDFTPVSITFSKDGHFLANTFSVSGLNRKLSLWKQHMPGKFAPWNGDMKAFNADFQKYLKNWEPIWEDADGNRRARPGQSDLDANAEIAIAKKNVFNDLIGVSSEEFNPEVSELPRKRFTREQKQRAKQSDPNTIFRSYRLDAMTDLIDSPVPDKYRIDYGLAKINFKPEGAEGAEVVEPAVEEFEQPRATTILSSNPQATNATYVPPAAESSGVEAGQARFMPEKLNAEHDAAYKAGDEDAARELVRKAAEQAGYTRSAKHGTTHNFTVFNTSSANIENDMGKGFYFSTSPKDVESNYAGKGPDLTNRVERLAEEIYNGWDNDEVDAIGGEDAAMREARQEAEQSLVGGEQRVIDAFINFKKPLIIGGKEETGFELEFKSEDSEPTGSIMELVESVQNKADEYQAPYEAQDAISKLMELGMDYGTVSAREAVDIIKKSFEYVSDPDTGDLAVNEFTREVFQNAGFDGIVDNTVNEKFGKRRKYGQTMAGIDENTQHIIAFNSESIKSADPFTYDDAGNLIPLSERFNPSTGDIRFMPSKEEGAEKTKKMSSLRVRVTREALTDAALSQASWKDWYSEHQETLDDFFGDNAPLFQNILAITSQAASVKANVGLALKAFGQLMRGEEFSGYLPAVAGNLGKLRDATGPSGQKIQAYKAANEGDASSVVVDRHIARMLFGVDTPTPKQFAKASKVLTEIADKIGWTPAQVQAALWAHSIVQSGKQPESYGNYLKRLESQGGITKRIGSFGERGAGSDVVGGQRGRYSPNDEGIAGRIAPADSDLAQTKFMPSKGDTWTEIKDAPTITLRDLIGRKVFPTFADLTSAGRIYKGIDSSEIAIPIETHGGPEWPLIQPEKVGEETNVWSNQGAGVSTTKKKRASEGAIMLVTTMSKDAHVSNTEVANAIIATNLAYVRDKRISSKNAEKLDSVIKKQLPDFPGFQSPDVSDYIKDLPFQGENSRARLSKILSQKNAEKLGAANVQRILDEMRSPDYEGARIGDAVMAIELTPGAPVLKLGEQGTMTHPSYQYAVRGKVIGKFARPINWEMIYDDFLSSRRAAGKSTKGDRRAIDLKKPLQLITEKIADRIPQEQYKNIKSARHAQVLMQAVNGEWRSSDGKIKDGAVSPSDFIKTLNASDAKQALDKYTLKGITEKIKKGEITLHQLADSQVYFATKPGDPATGYGKNPKDFGFGDSEKTLSLVLNGERGTAGMGDAIVQKALQEGVTALDCFAVKSEQYPDGMLPALYGRFGFEVVGEIPFDPSYYSELEVKDLEKFWRKNGWDESTGYPPVVLMKWRGNDKQRQSTLLELAGQNPQGIRRGTELFIKDARGGVERPDRRQSSGSEGRLLQSDAGRAGGVQEPPLSGIQLGRGTVGAIKELLGMPKDALRNLGLDPDMVKKFQPSTPPLGELSLPK